MTTAGFPGNPQAATRSDGGRRNREDLRGVLLREGLPLRLQRPQREEVRQPGRSHLLLRP